MECSRVFHHLLFGTYLAYTRPWAMKTVQLLFPFALLNRGLAKLFQRWLAEPAGWMKKLHAQTILLIQPPDLTRGWTGSYVRWMPRLYLPQGENAMEVPTG